MRENLRTQTGDGRERTNMYSCSTINMMLTRHPRVLPKDELTFPRGAGEHFRARISAGNPVRPPYLRERLHH